MNYFSTYSDTFSRILSVKNYPNFIFRQFHVFGYGTIPKNESAEFAEINLFKVDKIAIFYKK